MHDVLSSLSQIVFIWYRVHLDNYRMGVESSRLHNGIWTKKHQLPRSGLWLQVHKNCIEGGGGDGRWEGRISYTCIFIGVRDQFRSGGGGGEVSCPNIFSIACPKIKRFWPNITCLFCPRKTIWKILGGCSPVAPSPPHTPMCIS